MGISFRKFSGNHENLLCYLNRLLIEQLDKSRAKINLFLT